LQIGASGKNTANLYEWSYFFGQICCFFNLFSTTLQAKNKNKMRNSIVNIWWWLLQTIRL
jgi:hypothetical protein